MAAAGGSNISERVAATANRLRMVLVDLADQPEQARRECLDEVVSRALSEIVPDQRRAFLEELTAYFPGWETQVDVSLKKAQAVDRSPTDQREVQDPNFLVARLIQLAPSLSQRDRQVLVERLREAGLAQVAGVGWPEDGRSQVQNVLQVKPDAPLDLSRAMELICLLADFSAQLDQFVWKAWYAIHPRSERRRSQPLRELMAGLVRQDVDVSRGQVKEELDRLRGLIAAITSAVQQAGRHAWQYLAPLMPADIKRLVEMEGKGFLVGKEVQCWRKYVELSGSLSADTVENEIREAIAKHVESLMKGR